jgi:pilus assembly protein Flp/PilA
MARGLLYFRAGRQRPAQILKTYGEKNTMKDTMLKMYIKFQNLLSNDEGQDLVEYALVVALIALAATAGMRTLAGDISTAFSSVGTQLTTDI